MRLLAIDPGFKRFGYAVFDENAELITHGVRSPRERDKDEKYQNYLNTGLYDMYHWFDELIETYKITHIIAEIIPPISNKGNFGISPQLPLVISVIAVCKIMAYEDEIEWKDISARSVKTMIVGDSSASKAVVRRTVLAEYPEIQQERKLTDIPFDETDAISIGMSYFPDLHHVKDGEE
jgi:Holliday junction resolvasome RuvABC endonuclease subunit